jgi:diketogulonate reductase-like aldo/keto reductase
MYMAPVATLPRMGLGTAASSAASCDKLAVAVETYVRRGGSAIDTAFTYCGFGGRKHFALDQIAKGLTAAGAARQQIWLTSKVPVGMMGFAGTMGVTNATLQALRTAVRPRRAALRPAWMDLPPCNYSQAARCYPLPRALR